MALFDPIPEYLLRKHQMTSTVLFTALCSLVFLLVNVPFAHNPWLRLDADRSFGFAVAFFLGVVVLVALSRFVMYKLGSRYVRTFFH